MPDEVSQSELDVLGGDEPAEETTETTPSEEEETGTPESEETTEEATEEDESTSDDEDEEDTTSEESTDEKDVLEELDEEELEAQDATITRPSWKLIKEKYPDLAKDKDFRNIYFRDKAFTEVFPTVAEAKSAQEKAELFEFVDSSLASGNAKDLVVKLNEETREKLANNILPSLFSVDKKLFGIATRPVIINLLHEAYDFAVESKDENLRKSVRNLSFYLTKNADLPPRPAPVTSPELEKERANIQKEREEIFLRNQRDFLTTTDSVVAKKLASLVSEGLGANKELNDFGRQAVVEKTLADVRRILVSDDPLNKRIISLHKLAAKSGFTTQHKARIISALLERAKTVIPQIRAKHIASALGKQPSKGNGKTDKIVAKAGNEAKTRISTKGVVSVKDIDTKRTSEMDFLAGNVHLRK